MTILYYKYDYEYFTNILSLKMELRNGSMSLYESLFSRLFGVGAIDRTNSLPKTLDTKILKYIPSRLEDIPSYSETVNESAKSIISNSTLPLKMFYDGSIDATVALLAIIEEGGNVSLNVSKDTSISQKDLLNELGLSYDINEKIEYGEDIKKFNIISYQLGKVINDCDYAIHISEDYEWLNLDISELDSYLESLLISDKLIEPLKEQLSFIYSLSPVKLETVYDGINWLSFNLAYQGLMFEGWYDNKTIWRANETVKNFYSTDKFQRYSLKNLTKVISEENFKKDAKDYILSKTSNYNFNNELVYIYRNKTDLRFINESYKPFRDIGIE